MEATGLVTLTLTSFAVNVHAKVNVYARARRFRGFDALELLVVGRSPSRRRKLEEAIREHARR